MANVLADRLRVAQEALSTCYDRLNSQWKEAERIARSFNLSESVWVTFCNETSESDNGQFVRDWAHVLGYTKLNGEWRLCYSLGEPGDPDSFWTKPVLDCTLEQRKAALVGWPRLLEEIVKQVESEAKKVETALGAFAEAMSSFKNAHAKLPDEKEQGSSMKVRDVLRLLQEDGWRLVVTRGSHRQLKHPDKLGRVTVAGKPSDDIPSGTLNSIFKQAGLKRGTQP